MLLLMCWRGLTTSLSHLGLYLISYNIRCLQFINTKLIFNKFHFKQQSHLNTSNYLCPLYFNFCPKMSQTQSQKQFTQSQSQTQSQQYDPKKSKSQAKSKDKKKSKTQPKQYKQQVKDNPKKRAGKKKQQKPKQQKKQVGKKKPKSKKQGKKQGGDNKIVVLEYMQKQNRPYNLLNIFDNLHGKIKKSQLEVILNQLSEQGQFSCKQFGKNKVYYLNQQKFDLKMQQVDQLSTKYTKLKQQQKQFKEQNKRLNDQYRKLMSKKTYEQLQLQTYALSNEIQKLKKKKQYLVGEEIQKVDQEYVIKIEKQSAYLQKQLKKRKKLTKECLEMWSEMTEKKVSQAAEMMGIQLQ